VQVTKHSRGGVRFPSISPDGKTITYSNEFDLWVLPIDRAQSRKLAIDLGYVIARNLSETVTVENTADAFSPSPNGAYLAVGFRGEVFVVPSEEGVGEKRRITESAWRQGNAIYSPDGRYLAYLSDESKEEEVWLSDLRTGEKRKLTNQPSKKTQLRWTPDSKQILFASGITTYSVDIATARTTEIAQHAAGGYTLNQTTADGRWLVATRRDDYQNSEVVLYDVSSKREYNMTAHPARETNGLLTPDGKTLVFISNRDGGVNHLFSVTLAAPTEDPDDPLVREKRQPAGSGRGDVVPGAVAGPETPARARKLRHQHRSIWKSTCATLAGAPCNSRAVLTRYRARS
jgi:tricorn protease